MKRIATSLVGLPILFMIIKYLPPVGFLVVVAVSVVLGSYEFYAIAERKGLKPHKVLGAALGVAAAYTFFDGRVGTTDILCAAALLVPLASLVRGREGGERLEGALGGIAATFFAILFVGLLMGYSIGLLSDGSERGRDLTVLLFWVVWLSDAGAYAVGSLWGRHKLMPHVSPGKTVEGAIGALVIAVAASFAAKAWFFRKLSMEDALSLGLLLGLSGMAGDLAESLLKRSAAVKDSGWLFPGHGGMLDRADSLLFAAPVLFYYQKYCMA
ncbi:MAG TPA: phosphatidate cytidylyltransferase [Candidatus Polarisedimenticolia bacterium]